MKKRILLIVIICFLSLLNGITEANSYEVIGDIDGDKKIGLQEAVYALRTVAGIQTEQPANKSETEALW